MNSLALLPLGFVMFWECQKDWRHGSGKSNRRIKVLQTLKKAAINPFVCIMGSFASPVSVRLWSAACSLTG